MEIHLKNKCFCSGKEKDIYSEEPAVSRVLLVLVLEGSLRDSHPCTSAPEQEKLNTGHVITSAWSEGETNPQVPSGWRTTAMQAPTKPVN